MKYRYVIILIVVSFFIGAFLGRYTLKEKVEALCVQVEELQAMTRNYLNELDKIRTIDAMEKTIEAVGYLIAIGDSYDNQSHLGQKLFDMVERDLENLKIIDLEKQDKTNRKRIESLIDKAEKMKRDIEFKYL